MDYRHRTKDLDINIQLLSEKPNSSSKKNPDAWGKPNINFSISGCQKFEWQWMLSEIIG